ncbi:hypothetical protein E3P81_01427 [Wallemia ichthyophaga]|nr:hypothetical protein E3P97_01428 [Wallemia ichthyophaga]TIB32137.1 hypothetical protein E3P85_01929 [Wallemia ichthyophaga]TIB47967.1 hypothetical protein E3P82_01426 [Wallemia ichthyophaga]TIB52206.1 hypothetical protein E3P81_01427 [Wallemia ichthyophaga]TIB55027.1 hypothetical protein E3P80_01427 [Wallemia ichthyophaga]
MIRGCLNLTQSTIYVVEFPSQITFSSYVSEFLRDKLGVWLEDHADVSVSIVGVTTQAGRYFGQFYDIDNGNSTIQPRGVTSKSNKIMPRFDSPVNKLNRDPDINDANFEDADINVDENRAYFDYLFSDKEAEIL